MQSHDRLLVTGGSASEAKELFKNTGQYRRKYEKGFFLTLE